MEKLRIIVGGFTGLLPSGGLTWDYVQYPLGLKLLGHDVYYIEDTGIYPLFHTSQSKGWNDPTDTIQYLKETMEFFGFSNKWAYRDAATGNCFGLTDKDVSEVCSTADVFINVSVATLLNEEYLKIPARVLIDSDPMFTQVQDWDELQPGESYKQIKQAYSRYNYLFSFGENIGNPDCKVPLYDLKWIPTRQPIYIDHWDNNATLPLDNAFTTIMNWSARKKMKYKGEEWGQKDVEFEKFINMPSLFPKKRFQVIVNDNSKSLDKSVLENAGWEIFLPERIENVRQYKSFIQGSFGEFSVAKETYVKANTGWFSGRSACYLASGRPAVVQDTQWTKHIPSGRGLFGFESVENAIDALNEVVFNYEKHCKAAREIAVEYFDSSKVLTNLLNHIT